MLDHNKPMNRAAPNSEHDELLVHNHPLAKNLPVEALLRFDGLCAERDRLHSPILKLSQRRRQLIEDTHLKESTNRIWQEQARKAYTPEKFNAEIKKQEMDVAAIRARTKEISTEIETQSVVLRSVGNLIRRVEAYALSLSRIPSAHSGTPIPVGDPKQAAQKARAKIAALKDERAAIDAAPWPSSVVKAKAMIEIDAAATRGRPDVFRAVEQNFSVRWPIVDCDVLSSNKSEIFSVQSFDAFAVFAWLHRDRLLEMLFAEIDARADDDAALGQKERDAKHTDIAKRLLTAERDLEAAILASEHAGAAFRAHNQDPRAVLGLADDAPAMMDE